MKKTIIVLSLALLGLMVLPGAASAATLSQRVAALEKAVKAIKAVNKAQNTKIATLTGKLTTAQTDIATLTSRLSTAEASIAALQSNKVLALAPYVTVTSDTLNGVIGPNIIFQGANVHVRSTTSTADGSHLGNLIVGWNESPVGARTGQNNLVCGYGNAFTASGGFVAGFQNRIGANWATVSGGIANSAITGVGSTVSGGYNNTASGYTASVSGGKDGSATGEYNWVAGGSFWAD